jgi:4,5-DOPA dioxygenase extradiol
MPALFVGHGSPMNAISTNPYTSDMRRLGAHLPRPEAILVVSAHWQTRGTFVTSAAHPEQINDFYGFPDILYQVRYTPPGSPAHAARIARDGQENPIRADDRRGIDHAGWAVVKHLFPDGDVPLLELSLDATRTPEEHFAIGRSLASLRENGILVIGSGNIVHNLGMIAWEDENAAYDWAVEFDERARTAILDGDDRSLMTYDRWGSVARFAVPTNEHYLPLLYTAAMRHPADTVTFPHESMQNGSISMRCVLMGE